MPARRTASRHLRAREAKRAEQCTAMRAGHAAPGLMIPVYFICLPVKREREQHADGPLQPLDGGPRALGHHAHRKASLTATREWPRRSACQRHKSSCHSPCLVALFLSSFPPCASGARPTRSLSLSLPFLCSSHRLYSVLTAQLVLVGQYSVWHIRVLEGQLQ